jgi:hypothetical protein
MSCHDCGLEYDSDEWIEAVIPDLIWYEISPTKDAGGLLCISCMARRLKQKGYDKVPVWLCGMEPFKVVEGDPGDNLELLRTYKGENGDGIFRRNDKVLA